MPSENGTAESRGIPSRLTQAGTGAWAKGASVAGQGRDWADRQDTATRRGATIGWYRRFRESDGGPLAVLLTAYFFVTAIPAAVVMMAYVYDDPTELADRLAARLDLSGEFVDQARYFVSLLVPLVMILLYILQTKALHGRPGWSGWLLVPFWLAAVLSYFVMALFWIMLFGSLLVLAAALAPALAHRRELRAGPVPSAAPA